MIQPAKCLPGFDLQSPCFVLLFFLFLQKLDGVAYVGNISDEEVETDRSLRITLQPGQ